MSRTRLLALTTLAASGATVLVPTFASAATTTSVQLSTRHSAVSNGSRDVLSGSLRDHNGRALSKQVIRLLERHHGQQKFSPVTDAMGKPVTTTTSPKGSFSFSVTIAQNEQFEAAFAGNAKDLRSTSNVAKVNDLPVFTVGKTAVPVRNQTTLSVGVAPASNGQKVYLQKLVGSTYKDVASSSLDKTSSTTFTVTSGNSTYRVRIAATGFHAAGHSAAFKA